VIERVGYCRGLVMGESCAGQEECDVQLACRREWLWPHRTRCQPYAMEGEFCDEDYDCETKNVCILQNEDDTIKRCAPRWSADDRTTFGWEHFDDKTMMELVIHNGRYCKSGYAYRSQGTKAVCFSVRAIVAQSNKQKALDPPYKCDASATTASFPYDPSLESNRCRFYWGNQTDEYYAAPCDCAMTNGTLGFCRYPDTPRMQVYIYSMMKLYNQRSLRCHTLDRANLYAQAECGDLSLSTLEEVIDA
jgi:hypothetical protein